MAAIWKTLKVFISSTFRDLEMERDRLAGIFHNLEKSLFERQLTVRPYDLRWRDRSSRESLVEWCVRMVGECDYFIGILGDRYGWRPPVGVGKKLNTDNISITEMEIDTALAKIAPNRRFFCFTSFTHHALEKEDDLASMQKLKKRLQESGEKVYLCNSIEDLLAQVQAHFTEIVNEEYPCHQKVEPVRQSYQQAMQEFVAEKVRGFVGRESYLRDIQKFAQDTDSPNYLGIQAVAGTGKSALMARFVEEWKQPLVVHFMGMETEAREIAGILRSLGEQLQAANVISGQLSFDLEELESQIYHGLKQYRGKLVIAVDGLDEAGDSASDLRWLPAALPTNIRVLATSRPGNAWDILQKYPAFRSLELPPLQDEEIRAIIEDYGKAHSLELSPGDRELLQKRAAGNPLFLKVALDEIASTGIAVGQLAITVDSLFDQILERLEKEYDQKFQRVTRELEESRKALVQESGEPQQQSREPKPVQESGEPQQQSGEPQQQSREPQQQSGEPKPVQESGESQQQSREPKPESGEPKPVRECSGSKADAKKTIPRAREFIDGFLGLIAASRAGIQERELAEILGVGDDFLYSLIHSLKNFILTRKESLHFFHPEFERTIQMRCGKMGMRMHHLALADYLAKQGYAYIRTVDELPYQLQWSEKHEELLRVLASLEFWEAKCRMGMTMGLYDDLLSALHHPIVPIPAETTIEIASELRVSKKALSLLARALEMESLFLHNHPESVFQTLWNLGYWHDSPEAEKYYVPTKEGVNVPQFQRKEGENGSRSPRKEGGNAPRKEENGSSFQPGEKRREESTSRFQRKDGENAPWSQPGEKLYLLMEQWRKQKESSGAIWCKSLRPLPTRLDSPLLKILRGHEDAITQIAVTGDGKVVSASSDTTLRVWDIASGIALFTLAGHARIVNCMKTAPDGSRIVSASADKTIRIWSVKTGETLHTLEAHKKEIECLAISPDSTLLASGSTDKSVRIWNMDTGELLHTLYGHKTHITELCFSPDGRKLISGSHDNTIRVWNVQDGVMLYILKDHEEHVSCLAITSDGKKLVSGSYDSTLKIWDLEKGILLYTLKGHERRVSSVAVSSDGTRVASGSYDNTVRVWDAEKGALLHTLKGHHSMVESVAFSPNGRWIASGGGDFSVRIWETKTGKLLNTFKGHGNKVVSVLFTPDGSKVISGAQDFTVRIWSIRLSGNFACELEGHTKKIETVIHNNDGTKIVSASNDCTVRVWDSTSGLQLQALCGHSKYVASIAISPDGNRIASGSGDTTIGLWNVKTWKMIHKLQGHSEEVSCLAWHPDGRWLASGSGDSTIRMWDAQTGKGIQTLEGHIKAVKTILFSHDGNLLISGSSDSTIHVRNVQNGKLVQTLQGHRDKVTSLAISGDDARIVSTSADQSIHVWSIEDGKLVQTFRLPGRWIYNAVFSEDGEQVVSASRDKTIRIWDIRSGECVTMIDGHGDLLPIAKNMPYYMLVHDVETVIHDRSGKAIASFPGIINKSMLLPRNCLTGYIGDYLYILKLCTEGTKDATQNTMCALR